MKLLGWMHRKFRQNGGEPINDFVLGQAVQEDPRRLSCDSRQLKQSEIDHLLRKSFSGIDSLKIEFCGGNGDEGQLPADMAGLFHGFLAIGTLGLSEPSVPSEGIPTFELSVTEEIPVIEFLVEDGTPIFDLSVEDIVAEKETEITESELNLINEELEKALLGPGAEDDISSGRNSHVSAGRSSHASGGATAVCPLQGYLLGSVLDIPGNKDGADSMKKEQRTTLGELFRMTDEGTKEEPAKKGCGEDADASSVVKFVKKKMMKKKLLHAVSAYRGSSAGVPDPAASSENKLHKILQMFHKKVHPENETATYNKSHGKHKKVTFSSEVATRNGDKIDGSGRGAPRQMTGAKDLNKLTQNLLLKEKIRRMKHHDNIQLAPPTTTVGVDESNGSRECWIKTDEEYLVLEL
ncbi:hypothetical protein MLD38_040358 [Melastoma candidum]|uniref:Uncharacterized protein n=1 Tax=Melastoma candidum TaxID=119954 RepID=A0ACB9L500_9MYRT|nr:hypothetical protein MLD38_040358 [Melastoma candidum]